MDIWLVDREDGRIVLVAPNGERLFAVDDDTADMIGRMLVDEAEVSRCLVDDPDVDEEEKKWRSMRDIDIGIYRNASAQIGQGFGFC